MTLLFIVSILLGLYLGHRRRRRAVGDGGAAARRPLKGGGW